MEGTNLENGILHAGQLALVSLLILLFDHDELLHLGHLRLHVVQLTLYVVLQLRLLVQLEEDLLEAVCLAAVALLQIQVRAFQVIELAHQLRRLPNDNS